MYCKCHLTVATSVDNPDILKDTAVGSDVFAASHLVTSQKTVGPLEGIDR